MAGPTSYQVVIYKVEPSREAKHLAFVYTRFKRKIVKWLAEKKPALDDRELLDFIHKAWYKELERAGIPLALAFDLYRDCKNVYKAWLGQKRKKKPFPVVRKVSVILTPRATYELGKDEAKILGRKTKILGATNLSPEGKPAEARLRLAEGGWYLHVTYEKEIDSNSFSFKGLIAADINEDFIVVGNNRVVVQIPTRIDDACHYILLAQQLQKKYKKWRYIKAVIRRMGHFYGRARNILIDSARKIGKWVVETAEMLNANVIVLEDLHGLVYKVSNIRKKYRARFMLMQYRRIQHWIKWQAEKRGMRVITVPAVYTTFKCPKCGGWMYFSSYRTLKCEKCGFEENRDYIAVYNLYGRGLLHLSTAMSVKAGAEEGDGRPNDYPASSPTRQPET